MLCKTLILSWFGTMPAPGTVVNVYQSVLDQFNEKQVEFAKRCAARYSIRYRIIGK